MPIKGRNLYLQDVNMCENALSKHTDCPVWTMMDYYPVSFLFPYMQMIHKLAFLTAPLKRMGLHWSGWSWCDRPIRFP